MDKKIKSGKTVNINITCEH